MAFYGKAIGILWLAVFQVNAQEATFSRDVAPILRERCAPCHHDGGPGPFPLTTYDQARRHARQLVSVTRSRFMPPWLPEPLPDTPFEGELRLSAAQIETLARWVEQGMPPGDLAALADVPAAPDGWSLGKPDLVLETNQPFSVAASGPDVYWNFVFAPDLKVSRYVRAIEIKPRHAKLIHHANIVLDRLGTARAGFPGMEIDVPRAPLDFDSHFLFFKPGSTVSAEPDGFSWRIDPGTKLILNTHLQPSGKVETEQPVIALYFTPKPPTHFPYLLQLENDNALDIPPGARHFVVRDELRLPIDTDVLAVYPHAHYLGKTLEAFATLPGGRRLPLISILHWDPNWQAVYRYRTPLRLPAGTLITMRYQYENNTRPPRRVEAGNQASDEMAHFWLQVLPASPGDSRRAYAEAWARHEIEKNPAHFAANMTLGALALARFDAAGAVPIFRTAVAAEPQNAYARNLYGQALLGSKRNEEAMEQFRKALELKPGFANARLQFAHALANAGRRAEAVAELQHLLQENPSDPAVLAFLRQLNQR